MVKPNFTSQSLSNATTKPAVVEADKEKVSESAKADPAVEVKGEGPAEPEAAVVPNKAEVPADVQVDATPTPATKAAPTAGKGEKHEKRHPYTVQLSPTIWRRAKLLASLQGTSVSRFVETDLGKRIASDLKSLLETLDKVE